MGQMAPVMRSFAISCARQRKSIRLPRLREQIVERRHSEIWKVQGPVDKGRGFGNGAPT